MSLKLPDAIQDKFDHIAQLFPLTSQWIADNAIGSAQLAPASVTETELNLAPQFDSAGTSSLAITATGSGTAQDTGLTLTAAATGDYMIWATCQVITGASGDIFTELRINGTVVNTLIATSPAANALRVAQTHVWYAAGITSGQVVKVTAYRATANGTFSGENSSLLMQRVGP